MNAEKIIAGWPTRYYLALFIWQTLLPLISVEIFLACVFVSHGKTLTTIWNFVGAWKISQMQSHSVHFIYLKMNLGENFKVGCVAIVSELLAFEVLEWIKWSLSSQS